MGIAKYGLYDLSFRLDVLDTRGQQELNDFMIYGLKQPSEVVLKDENRVAQVKGKYFFWGGYFDVARTAEAVASQMGIDWQATGYEVANYKLDDNF
ncbi:hypothetical protein PMG11_10108 [Penicillium brasilianum]|uniref:Uncharacterized protein n=1 Tax=Penicillium brasilianum TaxID=104259 RepID=A0A0F7TY45_PENBI|nr:hypothetical protein PMG11_10108 [Penicillium brasilianum]